MAIQIQITRSNGCSVYAGVSVEFDFSDGDFYRDYKFGLLRIEEDPWSGRVSFAEVHWQS